MSLHTQIVSRSNEKQNTCKIKHQVGGTGNRYIDMNYIPSNSYLSEDTFENFRFSSM